MAEKLLRLPAVLERTGLNANDVYYGMKDGTFPKQVPLGLRSVAWVESEIEAYIQKKIAARNSGAIVRTHKAGPGRGHRRPVMAEAAAG